MRSRRPAEPLLVHDRRTGQMLTEPVLGERLLRWAYAAPGSAAWRPLLFARSWLSRLLGWYADSRLSRRDIARTVRQLDIDLADCVVPPGGWPSYNAFFTRRLRPGARPFDPDPAVVCSPADCRLLVLGECGAESRFQVKGTAFAVAEVLAAPTPDTAALFAGAAVVVARLCPADYHRFHFPCAGRIAARWQVPGRYDSVNPLPLSRGVRSLSGNRREVMLIESPGLGWVALIEVGAFGVGRIVQTHDGGEARKMEEKGYFAFGGSTIVLLFQRGRFVPDPDLLAHSAGGLETRVRTGERIGCAAALASGG